MPGCELGPHVRDRHPPRGSIFDAYDTTTSGTMLPKVGGFYYAPNAPGAARFIVDASGGS
jgi:hypothetical protein